MSSHSKLVQMEQAPHPLHRAGDDGDPQQGPARRRDVPAAYLSAYGIRGVGTEEEGGLETPGAAALPQGYLSHYGIDARRGAVQARGALSGDPEQVHQAAEVGVASPAMGLPHADRVKATFGDYDVGHVRAHHDPGATAAMGAHAYATGRDIVFAEANPSPELVGHELTHTLQQQRGVQLKDGVGATGDTYERQADAVGRRMAEGRSATDLLAEFIGPPARAGASGGAVQSSAVQLFDRSTFQGLSTRRVVTAATLNVYRTTTVSTANRIARLGRGDIVEVEAVEEAAGWFRITSAQYSGGQAVAPAPAQGPGDDAATDGGTGTQGTQGTGTQGTGTQGTGTQGTGTQGTGTQGTGTQGTGTQAAINGFFRDPTNAYTMPVGAQQGAGAYQTIVQNLVNDYNNVPVFPPGQTTGPTTFRTPYVLGDTGQFNTYANLQTRIPNEGGTGFKRVRDVDNTRMAFSGKGTPNAVGVIAQAAVDAGLTTAADIQAYINNGPMNDEGSRRNGRWGVDCSGFTAIAVAEMGGAGREAGPGMNLRSTEYRPGGSAITQYGFTQRTVGDELQSGDVIAFMSTNHVMVILSVTAGTVDAQAPSTNPAVTGTKRTLILTMGESSSTRMPGTNVGSVTDSRQLIAVEEAQTTPRSRYHTTNVNQAGSATWTLYAPPASGTPTWTLNAHNGIHVQNVGSVLTYSIVRPPSQRATSAPADLGP